MLGRILVRNYGSPLALLVFAFNNSQVLMDELGFSLSIIHDLLTDE